MIAEPWRAAVFPPEDVALLVQAATIPPPSRRPAAVDAETTRLKIAYPHLYRWDVLAELHDKLKGS